MGSNLCYQPSLRGQGADYAKGAVFPRKMVTMAVRTAKCDSPTGTRAVESLEMNELKTLEDRLKSASDRISDAVSARIDAGSGPLENAELLDENARLKHDLESLRAQRTADLAELDELLEQLRPLIEESSDA